jgi:hypothetical protein
VPPPAPLPRWDGADVVAGPPGDGPGHWAGGPWAVLDESGWVLAYRLRRPGDRGYANVLARSDDGVAFETVAVVEREAFGAASLERPALVRAGSNWRLYVSADPAGEGHWRVDLLEAPTLEGLAMATPRTVLPGDELTAVKDPVIVAGGAGWKLWGCLHPLDDPDATDRMTTAFATSADGVSWTWHRPVMSGRPGRWDARGVRFTSVLADGTAYYDGRATKEENFEEKTGLAVPGPGGGYEAVGDEPAAVSPHAPGGLRYLSAVALPGGGHRLYYEGTRADGSHELRTERHPGVPRETPG